MKKRLLFVIDSLCAGGGEKSLVTLLSLIDYTKYDVDLQLFSTSGIFLNKVPQNVHILKELDYFKFCSKPIYRQILQIHKLYSRLSYSVKLRLYNKSTHPDKARLLWQSINSCIPVNENKYDIAIAYSQGLPTFYVADKVIANKKIAWINSSLFINGKTKKFNELYYQKYTDIVTVSNSAQSIFNITFPQYKYKTCIINDIIDKDFINKMSHEIINLKSAKNLPVLLTVARLNNKHKGYDIALDACKILHDRGVKFRWYAIGEGTFRDEMEKFITENNLQDVFILLGTKENPYPYFNACDIYVQTSRHEGFGLSIAEARILNKPVVTTEFDAVWNQMVQGKNGIVVPVDATAVADAIQDLIAHPQKREAISAYQRTEKKGNIEELQKFYNLIND